MAAPDEVGGRTGPPAAIWTNPDRPRSEPPTLEREGCPFVADLPEFPQTERSTADNCTLNPM
jgi:hypothetical protein